MDNFRNLPPVTPINSFESDVTGITPIDIDTSKNEN